MARGNPYNTGKKVAKNPTAKRGGNRRVRPLTADEDRLMKSISNKPEVQGDPYNKNTGIEKAPQDMGSKAKSKTPAPRAGGASRRVGRSNPYDMPANKTAPANSKRPAPKVSKPGGMRAPTASIPKPTTAEIRRSITGIAENRGLLKSLGKAALRGAAKGAAIAARLPAPLPAKALAVGAGVIGGAVEGAGVYAAQKAYSSNRNTIQDYLDKVRDGDTVYNKKPGEKSFKFDKKIGVYKKIKR